MEKIVRIGIGVSVIKDDKFLVQILAQKRIGAHGTNTWALPGGHMELDES
jgi:8-oxo-dGTP diphosphatase